ncbi:MAG TPA: RNA-binding S4 domain-containing protein [Bacteroidales bacterium]|nr:RNA-binding S4 domain-containing protein [Bacteroidales bacterium]
MEEGVRIDKWLWAVRIFKTRSLATQACRSGKVKIKEQPVKPSHEIRTGDIITILFPPMIKTVKVMVPIENRVSAKLVPEYSEDLTPAEEYEKLQVQKGSRFGFRQRGTGRPTKRDRREIEILKKFLGD